MPMPEPHILNLELEPKVLAAGKEAGCPNIDMLLRYSSMISLRRIADALEARNAAQPDLWAFCEKLEHTISQGILSGSQKK